MSYSDVKKLILDKIKEYDSIIIVRHVRPDGDCMGSSLGLREILRESFPNKKIYAIGNDRASYLDFIGIDDEEVSEDIYKESLIICVDTATKNRISNTFYHLGKELIKIDHHINVEEYGNINYVREDMPATASIIMDFYDTFKDELKINQVAATALYTGVTTDTGRFRYRGVNGLVMKLAGDMIDLGLDIEEIYSNLYIRDVASLKLQGYVLNHFKTTENGVAYVNFSTKIQKKFGVDSDEAAALVNTLDSIEGKLIWIIFVELPDGTIRVRLRSRFVPVVDIASKYRGGGHQQAAGATVYNRREQQQMLKIADEVLKEFKLNNPGVR